MKFFT